MTNILGNIGFNFTGKLGIYLNGVVIDDTTTPDTTYLPGIELERFFNITNGVLTGVSFVETETVNVSAHFSIYSINGTDVVLPALKEFDAIIPSVVSVEFASLIPTGIVNAQFDTSALRIAKLIANDPSLAQKVAGAPYPIGVWNNSTYYNYGEMVSYFGKNYISKSIFPIINIIPTNTTNWYELVITLPPEVSVVPVGDNTAYSPGWNESLLVPTQNTIYDKINTIDGLVTTNATDIDDLETTKANLNSPVLITPTLAANPSTATNNLTIASTAYVKNNLVSYAPLTSPAFLSNPTATTQSVNDNSTRLATTGFVRSQHNRYYMVTYNSNFQTTVDNTVIGWSAIDVGSNLTFNSTFFQVTENGIYLFGGSIKIVNLDVVERFFGIVIQVNGVGFYRIGEVKVSSSNSSNIVLAPIILSLINTNQVRLVVTNFATNAPYRVGENSTSTTFWFGYKMCSL